MARRLLGFLFLAATTFMATNSSADGLSVTLETTRGNIILQLFSDKTPITSSSFVNLVQRGFYDGIVFHRVIPGFMAQGGDPTGSGRGGPGYKFGDEFDPTLKHDAAGILSMANAGPGTNGSQFFITFAPQPHLDGRHTVFGKVSTGMDVLMKIQQGDKINKAYVTGDTATLFSKTKDQLAQWNKVLDAEFPKKG